MRWLGGGGGGGVREGGQLQGPVSKIRTRYCSLAYVQLNSWLGPLRWRLRGLHQLCRLPGSRDRLRGLLLRLPRLLLLRVLLVLLRVLLLRRPRTRGRGRGIRHRPACNHGCRPARYHGCRLRARGIDGGRSGRRCGVHHRPSAIPSASCRIPRHCCRRVPAPARRGRRPHLTHWRLVWLRVRR